jgi:hypothetical protein
MKTKSITLQFITPLLLIAALTSCSNNATLTDDDAMRIIQQHVDFSTVPIIIQGSNGGSFPIKKDSLLGQEVSRLIQEGYLARDEASGPGYYQPTSKGKGMIGTCWWNDVWNEWEMLTIYGVQQKPVKITSKLIDSKTGVAVIQYQMSYTATEYLNSIYAKDTNAIGQVFSATVNQLGGIRQITLKLWDDGWHPQ